MNTLRKTKIVATIGPACDSPDIIKEMIEAGMNVARINLSFGADEIQSRRVEMVRQAARELGSHIAVMGDTRGIEIRTGRLSNGPVELKRDSPFALYCDDRPGDASGTSVSHRGLMNDVTPGTLILLDDGAIELEVVDIRGTTIHGKILHGGLLGGQKGVNIPGVRLSLGSIGSENREDVLQEMRFAARHQIEYVAASFVQEADDIIRMKQVLHSRGVDIPIIAKIENRAGVENLEEIVAEADGVMVARGDLGVELPLADVPGMQKKIIRTTVTNGKPVITATQMLASMENNPRPTRAEASDVANAILDGTSAVMLSGETAAGKYPVQAVATMADLALRAEESLGEYGYLQKIKPDLSHRVVEAVSQAAITMANHLQAAAIICLTDTGFTARQISKHRPGCPILAVTVSEKVARRLALNWGVIPFHYMGEVSDETRIRTSIEMACSLEQVKNGDTLVITAGHNQVVGGTDYIRVITVE